MLLKSSNERDTKIFAEKLSLEINHAITIYLNGDIGVGKTVFAQSLIKSLGFKGVINSPTFSIIKEYVNIRIPVYHFDFYRINDTSELEHIGIDDYKKKNGIFLIEWSKKGKNTCPKCDIIINFAKCNNHRKIIFYANTETGIDILANYYKNMQ